jgi:hypothetical protein
MIGTAPLIRERPCILGPFVGPRMDDPILTLTRATLASPLRASQAPQRRSLAPIRPHVRTYHPALGADRPPIQVQENGVVRPAVGVDDCAVMAEPSGAIDQQAPDPVRADVTQGDRRPSVGPRPPLRWRVVVRVAAVHQARFLAWRRTRYGARSLPLFREEQSRRSIRIRSICGRHHACGSARSAPRGA